MKRLSHRVLPALLGLALLVAGCSGNNPTDPGGGNEPPVTGDFVVFAWNDLGMHCLNPTYDKAVILPPYNTVWAEVVKKGSPPTLATAGLTVSYRILDNTTSYGKTDSFGAHFGQFWDNCQKLFGTTLAHDLGLNLADPARHNGLSGDMVVIADHFEVNGIPVTPVKDNGTWSPYQVAEITVKNSAGTVLATTRCTVPTSDEINCAKCHAQGQPGNAPIAGGGAEVFDNILRVHDALNGTGLVAAAPVLCASCHPTPALGMAAPGNPTSYLSAKVHHAHVGSGAACYDCHPGQSTSCNRSVRHTATDGNCVSCHGDLNNVAESIRSGGRVPWVSEPKCVTCHNTTQGVDTGGMLYRNARGHGNLSCPVCHGSPHAMVPSSQASDNYQALQYQKKAVTIGSCKACHNRSHGGGSAEFGEEHGGSRKTSCNICHTSVGTNTAQWPHGFTWKNR